MHTRTSNNRQENLGMGLEPPENHELVSEPTDFSQEAPGEHCLGQLPTHEGHCVSPGFWKSSNSPLKKHTLRHKVGCIKMDTKNFVSIIPLKAAYLDLGRLQ